MSLINGTDKSIFLPINAPGLRPIEFPLTNEGTGLKESWEGKGITHELLNYKLVKKHHGYRVSWTFGFSDWADGETLMKFKSIKNSLDAGGRWNLRPRNEEQFLSRVFEVVCKSDNFDVVNDSSGAWHTGFEIEFETVNLVPSIDWLLVLPTGTPIYYAVEIENVAYKS